jgi:hypothetical protein
MEKSLAFSLFLSLSLSRACRRIEGKGKEAMAKRRKWRQRAQPL